MRGSRTGRGGATCVSHADGDSDMVAPEPACRARWGGGRSAQRGGLCPPFCLGEAAPPALALRPGVPVPPSGPGRLPRSVPVPELREGPGSSESACGPFERTPVTPAVLRATEPPSPLASTARRCGESSLHHWSLGGGAWCGPGPLAPPGDSAAETRLDGQPLARARDQPASGLLPSDRSRGGLFRVSLVVGLLFSQTSGASR